MADRRDCDNCGGRFCLVKPIQVRTIFGIHNGKRSVFFKTIRYWCGRCCTVNDGKWRYARKGK